MKLKRMRKDMYLVHTMRFMEYEGNSHPPMPVFIGLVEIVVKNLTN